MLPTTGTETRRRGHFVLITFFRRDRLATTSRSPGVFETSLGAHVADAAVVAVFFKRLFQLVDVQIGHTGCTAEIF